MRSNRVAGGDPEGEPVGGDLRIERVEDVHGGDELARVSRLGCLHLAREGRYVPDELAADTPEQLGLRAGGRNRLEAAKQALEDGK